MALVTHGIADGVGWITLNTPGRLNAITVALSRELENAILQMGSDADVRVIVIRGSGGTFCAGGHFTEVEHLRSGGPAAIRPLFTAFRRACDAIAAIDVPVVAAVEGLAMAGGFELMQAADIVLVSAEAVIADTHLNFGMIPGGGSTQRLARVIGRQAALALILTGDQMSGADAARYGLAYRCFPQADFEESVRRFVADLALRHRAALTTVKRLVHSGLQESLREGLDEEANSAVAYICRDRVGRPRRRAATTQ
jgi:enoyl-CoA hydratase/carnithine racemase